MREMDQELVKVRVSVFLERLAFAGFSLVLTVDIIEGGSP